MTDAQSSGAGPSGNDKPAPSFPVPLELIQDIPEEKREELVRYISEISYIKHFIGGCIVIILSGYSVAGLLGIGGTVSLIAGAFLYRDHNNRKERKEREALERPTSPRGSDDRDDQA